MWLSETLIGLITCLKGFKGNTETTHNGTNSTLMPFFTYHHHISSHCL